MKIKNSYGKTELAALYDVSRGFLMKQINEEFTAAELKALRYNKNQKVFNKNQLKAIFQRLGNPFELW